MNYKRRHVTFETDYPAVDDFDFRNEVFVDQVTRRMKECFTPKAVFEGEGDELEVYPSNPLDPNLIQVRSGAAYIQGERARNAAEANVALSELLAEDNVVYIEYAQAQNSSPNAVRKDDEGHDHVVWYDDSRTLGAMKLSLWTNPDGKLRLATVTWNVDHVEVTDDRVYLKTAVKAGDATVETSGLAASAVTEPKLATDAVTETKLKAGTGAGVAYNYVGKNLTGYETGPKTDGEVAIASKSGSWDWKYWGQYANQSVNGPIRRLRLTCNVNQLNDGSAMRLYLVVFDPNEASPSGDPQAWVPADGVTTYKEYPALAGGLDNEEVTLDVLSMGANKILQWAIIMRWQGTPGAGDFYIAYPVVTAIR